MVFHYFQHPAQTILCVKKESSEVLMGSSYLIWNQEKSDPDSSTTLTTKILPTQNP